MRENKQNKECIAVIGSMTQAMQAQNVLAKAAIRARVTKADSSQTGRGCAYALAFPCSMESNVKLVLHEAGIRVRFYDRGWDG